jgi:hypothetical protein
MASTIKVDNIQNSAGTNLFVNGYPRQPGQVLEILTGPCDGSTITVGSGSYTLPNVSATQSLTTTSTTVTGSSIVYVPPAGTTRVVYEFNCALGWADAHAISHWRLHLDGTEILYARTERGGYYPEDRADMKWVFAIGGSTNNNTGRVASWNTPKLIEWKARDYGASNRRLSVHTSVYWDGGAASNLMMPILTITAIA